MAEHHQPELPSPPPDQSTVLERLTPDERRQETHMNGSGVPFFVARRGINPDPEEFPEQKRDVPGRMAWHGVVRQLDDGLDEVLSPEEQAPQFSALSDDELAERRATTVRGAALVRRALGPASSAGLVATATDKHGVVDGVRLAALTRARAERFKKGHNRTA